MNSMSRMTCLAALSATLSLAYAQGAPEFKKYQNASPELRAAAGLPPVPNQEPPVVDLATLRFMAQDRGNCAAVKVSPPVTFRGRTLNEIPDIREPRIRLANQLMSSGCYQSALTQIEAVVRDDPNNRDAAYAHARLTWMMLGMGEALRIIERTLERHPDFLSAKVLLGHIRFHENRVAESLALMNDVEIRSPTDVWVYLGKARVEVLRSPTRDLRLRMLEMANIPSFPPNVREGAVDVAARVPNQTDAEFEQVLKTQLAISHPINAPSYALQYAMWLGEGHQRFAEVITLYESPQSKSERWLERLRGNRNLLAQAYLMEAAKLSPQPGPANQALIAKANKVVNGDFTGVAMNAQPRPFYPTIKPFLDALVHPLEEDYMGETRLCRAIEQLNAAQVREALQAGADPKGRCRDESLVGSLVFMATREKDDRRREVMRALLEGGAPVTNIDACRSGSVGDCAEVLLPLMEKYERKAR